MPLAQSKDEATRALVIEVLGRIGDDRAVPILIDACLRDTSDRVRQSAAEELSWSKDPRVGPALVPALQDRNRQTQLFAVRGLFKHPQEDAIGPLLALMGHAAESMPSIGPYTSPAMVAESAAYALGAIGPKAYAPILGLLASSDPAVRNVGATALTECNDRRAIPKLIELCDAPDDPTRLRAAYALGRWSDPDSVVRLTRLMHFGTGYSAGMAAQSLARIGGSALDPVFAAARDKDPALREMAMNGFLSIEDRSAAPRLVEILNTDDVRVREMALFKLSMWLDVRALPQIVVMASDPDMERRRLAIGMLSNYSDAGHPEIIPPLLAGMTDANESVRSQAAGALFGKRDRRIGPAMRALLKSPIKDVPPLAEMVLKQYRR
jgi:HEAT repeat protein